MSDELISSMRNLSHTLAQRHTATTTITVPFPARFSLIDDDVISSLLHDDAAKLGIAVSKVKTRTTDEFTLTGSPQAIARILDSLVFNFDQDLTYSSPVNGLFLRARGMESFLQYAASQAGVDVQTYGAHYFRASGTVLNMAEFRCMLWDVEANSNGRASYYDQRQASINKAARNAEKEAARNERRARRQKHQILRALTRTIPATTSPAPDVTEATLPDGAVVSMTPHQNEVSAPMHFQPRWVGRKTGVSRKDRTPHWENWLRGFEAGDVDWTISHEVAYPLHWQDEARYPTIITHGYFDDEPFFPVLTGESKDRTIIGRQTEPVEVAIGTLDGEAIRLIYGANDLMRAEAFSKTAKGNWSYVGEIPSRVLSEAYRSKKHAEHTLTPTSRIIVQEIGA